MQEKCVIIGDIKNSREIENWNETFNNLSTTLSKMNNMYHNDLFVDFTSTIGDEFQGVLSEVFLGYISYINLREHLPQTFYCGIGVGQVEKTSHDDLGMRGTAFYRARDALNECKKHNQRIIFKSSDKPIFYDNLVNTSLSLLDVIYQDWTTKQKEVIYYYRKHSDTTYEKLGDVFNTSKQGIYDILKRARWHDVENAEIVLLFLLYNYKSQTLSNVNEIDFTFQSKRNSIYDKFILEKNNEG